MSRPHSVEQCTAIVDAAMRDDANGVALDHE